MRAIVPTKGFSHLLKNRLSDCTHVADHIQRFTLDFITNLTRQKGDDGDASASTRIFTVIKPASGAFVLSKRVFVSWDGKISAKGNSTSRDQDTIHTTS